MKRRIVAGILVAACLSGCSTPTAPTVTVSVGEQSETLKPTQYCLDGTAKVFTKDNPDFTPPVLKVGADEKIEITAPKDLATSGWQIQIFSYDLKDQIGEVPVGKATHFSSITTSDAAPAAYFLVIVQDAGKDCKGLSGAWPIGFIRDQ